MLSAEVATHTSRLYCAGLEGPALHVQLLTAAVALARSGLLKEGLFLIIRASVFFFSLVYKT